MRDKASERVRQLIDRYGADPERFPEAERSMARTQLEQDPELATLAQQAREFDELLALSTIQAPSADLQRRVAEIPLRHPQSDNAGWSLLALLGPSQSLWRAAGVTVASALLGLGSGMITQPDADGTLSATQATVTVDTSLESWEDFAGLAFADDLVLTSWDTDEEDPDD